MKVLGDYNITVAAGDPSVLGTTVTGRFVNFAVAVPSVSEVVLHVYDGEGKTPLYSIRLGEEDRYGDIFSVKVADTAKDRTYLYETKGEHFLTRIRSWCSAAACSDTSCRRRNANRSVHLWPSMIFRGRRTAIRQSLTRTWYSISFMCAASRCILPPG